MTVDLERQGAVVVARLRGGKANSMSIAFLGALNDALEQIERSDATAIVFTADGRSFSAGLALPELIDLDRAKVGELIDLFERTMRRILTSSRATVAAINGHAFAGGCVLALMCDARIMAAGQARIGLNEVQLGIGLPASVIEPLRLRVPASSLTTIALEGKLLDPEEARRLALVDDVVEPSALVPTAIERATALGGAPLAYAQIKRALLAPVVDGLDRRRAFDREAWLDTWFSDHAQRTLRATVDRILKR